MFTTTCNVHISANRIFGTLKDESLPIHSLASNNCFSNRNFFQNAVNALTNIVDDLVSKEVKILCISRHRILFNFF